MIKIDKELVTSEKVPLLIAGRIYEPSLNKTTGKMDYSAVAGSELGGLTFSLVNDADNATINSRTDVDIESYVDENGWLEFWLEADDNVIVDEDAYPPGTQETHKIIFTLTSGTGHVTPIEKKVYVKSVELVASS